MADAKWAAAHLPSLEDAFTECIQRALMDMPDKPLLHASRLLHSLAIAAGEISDDVASPTGSERCAAHVEPRTPAVAWESPRLDTPERQLRRLSKLIDDLPSPMPSPIATSGLKESSPAPRVAPRPPAAPAAAPIMDVPVDAPAPTRTAPPAAAPTIAPAAAAPATLPLRANLGLFERGSAAASTPIRPAIAPIRTANTHVIMSPTMPYVPPLHDLRQRLDNFAATVSPPVLAQDQEYDQQAEDGALLLEAEADGAQDEDEEQEGVTFRGSARCQPCDESEK